MGEKLLVKIAFYELEGWEEPYIREALPQHSLTLETEPLNLQNIGKAADAEILSTFIYSQIGREILDNMPKLKAIVTRSTGYDHIDLEACRERGVAVYNDPAYGTSTVAEFTIMLMLMLARKYRQIQNALAKPRYTPQELRGMSLPVKL